MQKSICLNESKKKIMKNEIFFLFLSHTASNLNSQYFEIKRLNQLCM